MSAATAMIASIVISILLDNLGSWPGCQAKRTPGGWLVLVSRPCGGVLGFLDSRGYVRI